MSRASIGLFKGGPGPAPEYISDTDFSETSNNSGTRSFSHTTTAATDCLVVVFAGCRSSSTPDTAPTIEFNNVAMTVPSGAAQVTSGGSPFGASYIAYMLDPPIGTFNVEIDANIDQRLAACAINLSGVGALGPVSDDQTSTAGSTLDNGSGLALTTPAIVISGAGLTGDDYNSETVTFDRGTPIQSVSSSSSYGGAVAYERLTSPETYVQGATASGSCSRRTLVCAAFTAGA